MKSLESIVRIFVDLHPDEAARAFETLPVAEAGRLMQRLPTQTAAGVLARLSPSIVGGVVEQLPPERACELLNELEPRSGSVVLKQLSETQREAVLSRLPEKSSRWLRELSEYPPDTAGGMMEPKVASLPLDLTAQQAISTIRKAPREALHYLYVTQRDGKLVGVLNMRDLLLASPRDPIQSLVRQPVISVPATMETAEVVELMTDRKFLAMPVVDMDGKLIGVVRHDEALHQGQLQAFEDMQRIVGAGGDERALSTVATVIKRRLPWLYVNLVTAFLAAAVVGLFEGVIAQVTALAVLLPVVSGQGGNSGSQSLAIVMRGLALREIVPGVERRVMVKELTAALANGVAVALVTSLAVYLWSQSGGLALVIGLAMVINMAAASAAGTAIPLILRALGRDPAQSAAIFLTTVTDIVGFASFLGLAMLFMKWLV